MDSFILSQELSAAIIAHARSGHPDEVCGLIAGKGGVGMRLYRGRNVSSTPRVRFEMDADTLMQQLAFEDEGLELAAVYHSHPHGPAGLSQEDLFWAPLYPGAVQILCNLADESGPVLRAYRIRDGQAIEIALAGAEPGTRPSLPHGES